MRITFNRYPVDIILCILFSLSLLPLILLDINEIPRIIFGLPFILFIPGYLLILALFPTRKTDRGIDVIERIVLSIGISLAIVSLIGIYFNYTHYGVQLIPIFITIFIFTITIGFIAFYRWNRIKPDERFILSLDLKFIKSESKLDKALTIIIIALIIIAIVFLAYTAMSPKSGEKFTDFYVLGPNVNALNYPKNLSVGENTSVVIGITNHEQQTMDYTVEIWLINQTTVYNENTKENDTIYHNMWFIDKIEVTLDHIPLDIEESWKPQWDYNFSFNINKKGENFKLVFLLFTKNTDEYNFDEDYKDITEEKLSNAYRELYLWINVT